MTNAAIAGSKDELRGLKENVVIGHLIPAGTGMKKYRQIHLDDEKLLELQKSVYKARKEMKAEEIDDDEFDVEQIADMKTVGDAADIDGVDVDDSLDE